MPLVIHPRVRKVVGRVAAVTCVAVFAGTGAAYAACGTPSVSTPFAQWGDNNSYFAVPGGTFQGSDTGWDLDNASLTPGGTPYDIDGGAADQSLTVDAGGSAASPFFCLDQTMRTIRFLARETAPGSDLVVEGLVPTRRGDVTVRMADISDGSMPSWAPVDPIETRSELLPAWAHMSVAVRFVVPGPSGAWQIDDVYVDPYRAG